MSASLAGSHLWAIFSETLALPACFAFSMLALDTYMFWKDRIHVPTSGRLALLSFETPLGANRYMSATASTHAV